MNRKLTLFTLITVVGLILDQVTKWWVRTSPDVNAPGGITVIPGFFSIVHAENPGAAFGMLGNLSENWRIGIFVVFTLIAIYIVADMYRKLPPNEWFLSTTLGLILSGALGNVIDRVYKPFVGVPNHVGGTDTSATVTDFLRFYTEHPGWAAWLDSMFGTAEYPTFNVADISLVVGVGLFIVHYLFIEGRQQPDDGADLPPTEIPVSREQTPASTRLEPAGEGDATAEASSSAAYSAPANVEEPPDAESTTDPEGASTADRDKGADIEESPEDEPTQPTDDGAELPK